MEAVPPRAGWRVKKPTAQPEPPRLDGLLEAETDAIPVRITIVQDDVTTGWDDGALGFEDDAVWFSGRATSFRLAAPDVLPGAYLLSRREPVTSGEALNQGFPLRHPTRGVWVRVRVLTEGKEEKAEHEVRLIAGVKRLRASGDGSPSSEERAGGGTVGEGVAEGGDAKPFVRSAGVAPQVEGVAERRDAKPLELSDGTAPKGEGSQSEYPPLSVRPGMVYQFGVPIRLLYAWGALEGILFIAAFGFVLVHNDEAVGLVLLLAIAVFLGLGALMQGSGRMEAFRRGEGIEPSPEPLGPPLDETDSPALAPPP